MNLRRVSLTVLVAAISLTLISCDLLGSEEEEEPTTLTNGIFVANQGNFSDANGTVSVYNPRTGDVTMDALDNLNTIIQSIALQGDRLYLTANSAGRLDVFDSESLGEQQQITDLNGPRYLAFSNQTAFLTDQSFGDGSKVQILDVGNESLQATDNITVSGTPDGITATENRVYAALGAFGSSTLVASIDANQQSLIDEIDIGCASRYTVSDAQDEVFAFCSDKAEAVILDGSTGNIQSSLSLPDTAETTSNIGQVASFSEVDEEIHVATDTGILRIDTESNTVATTLEVGEESSIGAVAYDGLRQELYVGRVSSFTERGTVTIHDRDGTETDSFQAGIAPVYIDFRRIEE